MTLRIWLGIANNMPVPIGPTRNKAELSSPLSCYRSIPDADGTMLDGNPFSLFVKSGEGEPEVICLEFGQTEATAGGRTYQLRWFEAIAEVGQLLLITGELNCGDCESVYNAVAETGPFAYAYCLGWNRMSSSNNSGKLPQMVSEIFGLPLSMCYPKQDTPKT